MVPLRYVSQLPDTFKLDSGSLRKSLTALRSGRPQVSPSLRSQWEWWIDSHSSVGSLHDHVINYKVMSTIRIHPLSSWWIKLFYRLISMLPDLRIAFYILPPHRKRLLNHGSTMRTGARQSCSRESQEHISRMKMMLFLNSRSICKVAIRSSIKRRRTRGEVRGAMLSIPVTRPSTMWVYCLLLSWCDPSDHLQIR